MSDNKLIAVIKVYHNTLIDRYSGELCWPHRPKQHRILQSCGGARATELQQWLCQIAVNSDQMVANLRKDAISGPYSQNPAKD
jgi:hypothetical protein